MDIDPNELKVLEYLEQHEGRGDVPDALRFYARQMADKDWLTNIGTMHGQGFLMDSVSYDLLAAIRAKASQGDTPPTKAPLPVTGQQEPKPSLDARALAVFIDHPDWTKKKMAEHLGCNEKSLAPRRCVKLDAAIRAYKAKPKMRRGSRDSDGNLEAWEE